MLSMTRPAQGSACSPAQHMWNWNDGKLVNSLAIEIGSTDWNNGHLLYQSNSNSDLNLNLTDRVIACCLPQWKISATCIISVFKKNDTNCNYLFMLLRINSLAPRKFGRHFRYLPVIFQIISVTEVSLVKLPLDECHSTLLMVSQHWFR